MPKYRVKAPDGKTYTVNAPEGATQEQVFEYVQGQIKTKPKAQPKPKEKGFFQQLGESTANVLGGVAQGVSAIPDMLTEATGDILGAGVRGGGELVARGAEAVGLDRPAKSIRGGSQSIARDLENPITIGGTVEAIAPTPKDFTGRTVRTISQALGGAGTGVGIGQALAKGAPSVARNVGQVLSSQPAAQATGATTGAIAAEMAKESGAPVPVQIGAGIIGGVAGGYGASKVGQIRQAMTAPAPAMLELEAAERAGVRVLTSDVHPPKTFAARWTQATGEKIPWAGTGPVREAQQNERIEAVRNVLRNFGADDAASASDDVMKDLARQRSADLTRNTTAKRAVIERVGGNNPVPVPRTIAAIDKEIADLQSLRSRDYDPIIARLEDWKSAIQNQPLKNVESLRRQFGESFKAPELASVRGTGEKSLTNIYGPLREDMGDFIKSTGKPGDFKKWTDANARLSELAGELKSGALKSVLKRGEATPEVVNRMLFSQNASDVRQLYSSLSPMGKAHARAAILARAAEKAGGIDSISPDKFANEVGRLGKSIGVFFTGDDLSQVQGLARVLDITKRAGQAGVAPPTGVQVAIPVGAAVAADFLGGAGAATATGAGVGAMARIYESAPVRNLLINLSRTKPGSPKETVLINRLMSMEAFANPTMKNGQPIKALNDNFGRQAAASDQEEE